MRRRRRQRRRRGLGDRGGSDLAAVCVLWTAPLAVNFRGAGPFPLQGRGDGGEGGNAGASGWRARRWRVRDLLGARLPWVWQ